jgi:NAD(P)-dependent dehydrogenase (short-subunit alcohol dehydrogenase family)
MTTASCRHTAPEMASASIRNGTLDLEQKVALVTGGAHGLGRHTCSALAWAGARIVVVDIDERGGDAVARAAGGAFVAADLSQSDANHDVVAAAMERYGRLDLVHLGPSTTAEPLLDPVAHRETMSAMVDRVTYGTQAALAAFEATGDGGAIVAASIGPSPDPADVASDHALIGLARALGAILGPRRVRFNTVLSDARAWMTEEAPVDELYDKLVRTVDSADAADAVVALLAGEMSGECWLVRSSRDDAQRPRSALRA